jgi:hypothetical protein
MIFKPRIGDFIRAKRTTAIGVDRLDGFSGSPGYPQPGTVYQVSQVQSDGPDDNEPLVALVGGFDGPFFASRFEPVENSLFALLLPDSQP